MRRRVEIVGAGPAGIAAAIWARRLDWEPTIYERRLVLGGQLNQLSLPIMDLPGFPATRADELCQRLSVQLERLNVPIFYEWEAIGYDRGYLHFAEGRRIASRAVVLAPGLRARRLTVPGADLVEDISVSDLLAVKEPGPVAVIGGGDRAVEAACRLAESGIATLVIHRGYRLGALPALQERLAASGAEVWTESRVAAVEPWAGGWRIHVDCGRRRVVHSVHQVVVRIGMIPDLSPRWQASLNNEAGRVYLIGDAAQAAAYRSLVTAFADGMTAVKTLVSNPIFRHTPPQDTGGTVEPGPNPTPR